MLPILVTADSVIHLIIMKTSSAVNFMSTGGSIVSWENGPERGLKIVSINP